MTDTMNPKRHYPAPAPARDGESESAYTERLLATKRLLASSVYDHPRNRQCALGYHTECSENRPTADRQCRCPHHDEPPLTEASHPGASILAELYYLPEASADRIIRIAAPLVAACADTATVQEQVREQVSAAYCSDIGAWLAIDIVSILRRVGTA